jgi:hypothetical protein
MTITSAASTSRFKSMPRKSAVELDVPIVLCPNCEKPRPMTIKAIVPHLRMRDGAEVEYSCAECGALERKTVKPVDAGA